MKLLLTSFLFTSLTTLPFSAAFTALPTSVIKQPVAPKVCAREPTRLFMDGFDSMTMEELKKVANQMGYDAQGVDRTGLIMIAKGWGSTVRGARPLSGNYGGYGYENDYGTRRNGSYFYSPENRNYNQQNSRYTNGMGYNNDRGYYNNGAYNNAGYQWGAETSGRTYGQRGRGSAGTTYTGSYLNEEGKVPDYDRMSLKDLRKVANEMGWDASRVKDRTELIMIAKGWGTSVKNAFPLGMYPDQYSNRGGYGATQYQQYQNPRSYNGQNGQYYNDYNRQTPNHLSPYSRNHQQRTSYNSRSPYQNQQYNGSYNSRNLYGNYNSRDQKFGPYQDQQYYRGQNYNTNNYARLPGSTTNQNFERMTLRELQRVANDYGYDHQGLDRSSLVMIAKGMGRHVRGARSLQNRMAWEDHNSRMQTERVESAQMQAERARYGRRGYGNSYVNDMDYRRGGYMDNMGRNDPYYYNNERPRAWQGQEYRNTGNRLNDPNNPYTTNNAEITRRLA